MSRRTKEAVPPSAFRSRVLEILREREEPDWVSGSEMQVRWKVVRIEAGWGVFREWEDPAQGHVPKAVCASQGRSRQ